MRIASLNAWGGQVWPALGSWAQSVRADVLSCQEMIEPAEPSPPWLAYKDAHRSLNQRANLFADLSTRLPEHRGWFQPVNEGPLSDTGGQAYRSRHGLGQWIGPDIRLERRLEGFVHGAYRGNPTLDGWGTEPVTRGFQATRIITEQGPLTVAHFHGLRDPDGKDDTPARADQARRAITLLSQIATPDEDVVLSGDFNVLPGSETLQIFAAWGLRDLVGDRDTRTQLYPKPVRHANYMLVSRSVKVAHFDAPADPVVSDHRPLILETEA